MKSLKCDQCDTVFEAEDFDGWFKQMMPHYQQDHADIMQANQNKTKEEGMQWMADMKQKFENA